MAPLAEDPIEVPPVATVYQSIVLPKEVAFKGVVPAVVHAFTGLLGVTPVGADGSAFTVRATLLDVKGQVPPLSTTVKVPASVVAGLVIVNVAVVTPLYGAVFVKSTPFLLHCQVVAVEVMLIVLVPDPAQTAAGATGCTLIVGPALVVIVAVAVRVALKHPAAVRASA